MADAAERALTPGLFHQPGVEAIPIDDEPHVAALGDDLDLVADGNVEADLPPVDFRHLDLGRNFHARRRRGIDRRRLC